MRLLPAIAVCAALALLLTGCPQQRRAGEEDPLGPNAACYVCHMTFVREELSKVHLAAKVGCIKCHGLSAAHANDEDVGATKPDIAYTRAEVNPSCRKCHIGHDAAPEKVVARWNEVLAAGRGKQPPADLTCTDCHGTHRIARARQQTTQ